MKRFCTLLAFAALFLMIGTTQIHAEVSDAAVLYLRVAAGARAAGMGEAFVAIADDATATYWNPAGLATEHLSGRTVTVDLPSQYSNITSLVTLDRAGGGDETWVIADGKLLKYDGRKWVTGNEYRTTADQTLEDFVRTTTNIGDKDVLQKMAMDIIWANTGISPDEIDQFIDTVRVVMPEDYSNRSDLERGLVELKNAYLQLRLISERYHELWDRLREGMQDGSMSGGELDRITYGISQAIARFLPTYVEVPYSTSLIGTPQCLGRSGKFLWVGTDQSLYRLSGDSWTIYNEEAKLPSTNILTMANSGDLLMIGTDRGLIQYYHGTFSAFAGLPAAKVQAIDVVSPELAYAVIGNLLFKYDGQSWTDSYTYTVRLDDDLEMLVDMTSIYGVPEEKQFLEDRINGLNQRSGPTWLNEGNEVSLPLSPEMRYEVTGLAYDQIRNVLYVGTESGLLSFDGKLWNRIGYTTYVVPDPPPANVREIAAEYVPDKNEDKITVLAENIKEYNELEGRELTLWLLSAA
jgi:hypothetical protein